MFKRLCGKDAMRNVILATTMWDKVSSEEGAKREIQLIITSDFWGWMVENSSRVFRYTDDRISAMKLVDHLLKNSGITLDVQEEMVNNHKTLNETSAGRELESGLAEAKAKFQEELREVEAQMKQAQLERDAESQKALRAIREESPANMKRVKRDREELKTSMQRLNEVKYTSLERQLSDQQEAQRQAAVAYAQQMENLRSQQSRITLSSPSTPSAASTTATKLFTSGTVELVILQYSDIDV